MLANASGSNRPFGPELRIGQVDAVVTQARDEGQDGLFAVQFVGRRLAGGIVGCGRAQRGYLGHGPDGGGQEQDDGDGGEGEYEA